MESLFFIYFPKPFNLHDFIDGFGRLDRKKTVSFSTLRKLSL